MTVSGSVFAASARCLLAYSWLLGSAGRPWQGCVAWHAPTQDVAEILAVLLGKYQRDRDSPVCLAPQPGVSGLSPLPGATASALRSTVAVPGSARKALVCHRCSGLPVQPAPGIVGGTALQWLCGVHSLKEKGLRGVGVGAV